MSGMKLLLKVSIHAKKLIYYYKTVSLIPFLFIGNAKFMGDLILRDAKVGTVFGKDIQKWSKNVLRKDSTTKQIIKGESPTIRRYIHNSLE